MISKFIELLKNTFLFKTKKRTFVTVSVLFFSVLFTALIIARLRITTIPVKVGTIVEAIYGLGTVKSNQIYTLKTAIPASIIKLPFSEGDAVKQGQTILVTDGVAFPAPITGTLTKLYFQKGETIMVGNPVLTIVNMEDLEIELSLDQDSALQVKPGQKAELSFEALRGKKVNGLVHKRYPTDGQFIVKIKVDDLPKEILPDMTADVAIEVAVRKNIPMIPLRSVQMGYARISHNGRRIKKTKVKIGAINEEWAELLEPKHTKGMEVVVPESK